MRKKTSFFQNKIQYTQKHKNTRLLVSYLSYFLPTWVVSHFSPYKNIVTHHLLPIAHSHIVSHKNTHKNSHKNTHKNSHKNTHKNTKKLTQKHSQKHTKTHTKKNTHTHTHIWRIVHPTLTLCVMLVIPFLTWVA
jgi:predicted tellurium resistance membrane protein TerC